MGGIYRMRGGVITSGRVRDVVVILPHPDGRIGGTTGWVSGGLSVAASG